MRYPFSLLKRKRSRFYQVRFKNSITGKYDILRSTGATSESEAVKIAMEWYVNGIPTTPTSYKDDSLPIPVKNGVISHDAMDLISRVRSLKMSKFEVKQLVDALTDSEKIRSAVIANSPQDIKLTDYLIDFWTWDKSEYIKEKLRMRHGIHKRYVNHSRGNIQKYWVPYFKDKTIGEITKKDLKEFLQSLGDLGIANATINRIFTSGATALRYAYSNEIIEHNVAEAKSLILYSKNSRKREILTMEQMQAVLSVTWKHYQSKLAFFVSAFSGMRAGEIQALKLSDLGENKIYVNHSFNYADGLKSPKNGEKRVAQFNFPEVIEQMKQLAYENPNGDFFVFCGLKKDVPMDKNIWLKDFRRALVDTGIMSAEDAKRYEFHGQRHFFTTAMKDLNTDSRFLQMQTGHKTLAMLEHYANHQTEKAEKEISENQLKLMKEIFPDESGNILTCENKENIFNRIANKDFIATLPKPEAKDPIEALRECGLLDGDRITTEKGLSICVYFLLHYGYDFKQEDFEKLHIKDFSGKEYRGEIIGATIRKIKNKRKKNPDY